MPEEKFMRRALNLALKGEGWTNPNPMVGALVVKNGRIVGEGFHEKFGEAHAEINAIEAAGSKASDSTLIVNLEPCSNHGKTPPCTDAIIKAGIRKIIYASSDPTQRSSKILGDAGVQIVSGILKAEADFLNRKFLYFIKTGFPYITIKFAASLDGKLATKTYDSKWITNDKARKYARSLRAGHQAVLVGSATVVKDNPHLGVREKNKKDPTRIILDTGLKTPVNAAVYRDSNVIVLAGSKTSEAQVEEFQSKGMAVHKFGSEKVKINEVLKYLSSRRIISVLVEGGGEVIGSFADSKMVNEIYAFYAPVIVGGTESRSIGGSGMDKIKDSIKIKSPALKQFDDNFLIHGLV